MAFAWDSQEQVVGGCGWNEVHHVQDVAQVGAGLGSYGCHASSGGPLGCLAAFAGGMGAQDSASLQTGPEASVFGPWPATQHSSEFKSTSS